MRNCFSAVCLVLVLAVTGCTGVSSTHQVGAPLAEKKAKQFEGVWLGTKGDPVFIKHIKDNELLIGSIEWDDTGHFKVKQFTVFLTSLDDAQYLNYSFKNKPGDEEEFVFCHMVAPDSETLVVHPPRDEIFQKAIEEGKLPGKIEKDNFSTSTKIRSTKQQLDEFIKSGKVGLQFEVTSPTILRRVQKPEAEETVKTDE